MPAVYLVRCLVLVCCKPPNNPRKGAVCTHFSDEETGLFFLRRSYVAHLFLLCKLFQDLAKNHRSLQEPSPPGPLPLTSVEKSWDLGIDSAFCFSLFPCEDTEKYNTVLWQWCYSMAIYHRKMQPYAAYSVSLYFQESTKGPWSQVCWESLLWDGERRRIIATSRGRRKNKIERRWAKRTSTSCTERILSSHGRVER